MVPCVSDNPMAYAALIVSALIASSGVNFILMQAKLMTTPKFPVGVVPGLKSLASATGKLASINLRASPNGMEMKCEQLGKSVGMQFEF